MSDAGELLLVLYEHLHQVRQQQHWSFNFVLRPLVP
jgi:hypothetical protein